MKNDIIKKEIQISSLPNAETTIIPTGLTFDSINRIILNIFGSIKEENGEIKELPISVEDRQIFFTITKTGNILITTTKDESKTSANIILEYREL